MESPEPPWLSGAEQEAWFALVAVMTKLPTALDAQLQRGAGLSLFEYLVLAGLSMSPERTMRMSELAAFAEGSLARLSQAVARLEKRGWVRRNPDPSDGRYTLAVLTGDGWDKITATAPGHVAEARRLVFDPLTKAQVRQLRDIGNRISHAIDPDGPCPSARRQPGATDHD